MTSSQPTAAADSNDTRTPTPAIFALITLLALLWGGNTVFIKIALRDLPPFALSSVRFLLGSATVGGWALIRGIRLRPTRSEARSLAAMAVLFLLQTTALTFGTDLTTAARAAIFISTFPFFTALFAHLLIPADSLNTMKSIGITIAFAGVVLTVGGGALVTGGGLHLRGDLITLASGAMLGLRTVITKRMVRDTEPVRLLFWMMVISLPGSIALSALLEVGPGLPPLHLSLVGVGAMLYTGVVVAGFCFITSTTVLRRYAASKLTVLFFSEPLFGVILSRLIVGDAMSWRLLAGALLVAAGIYLVNRQNVPKEAENAA